MNEPISESERKFLLEQRRALMMQEASLENQRRGLIMQRTGIEDRLGMERNVKPKEERKEGRDR